MHRPGDSLRTLAFMRARLGRRALLAAALAASTAVALASPWRARAEATAPAVQDVVVLKNGTRHVGRITRQEPGKYVIIETSDAVRTVMWEDLKEIVMRPVAAPASSSASSPSASAAPSASASAAPSASAKVGADAAKPKKKKPAVDEDADDPPATKKKPAARAGSSDDDEDDDEAAPRKKPRPKSKDDDDAKKRPRGERRGGALDADASGAKASVTHECAEDEPECRERMGARVGKGGAKATYEKVEDCSDEDDENCTETTSAEGGTGGIGVSYTRESVKVVDKPTRGASNLTLALGLVAGFGHDMTLVGSSSALSYRLMTGGRFPDRRGGGWFGVFFEPFADLDYVNVSTTTPRTCVYGTCYGGETTNSSSGMLNFGTGAGLQWVHFGRMDEKSKKQRGFGLALGGRVGGSMFLSSGSGGSTNLSFMWGPVLSLIFPTFNPGTASYSMFQVNFLVLPMKDFVFVVGGVQWGFG